jgi:NitT/TauT family transport system permease protein
LLVRFPAIEESVYRLGVMIHALPLVAIAPLLVVWLGSGYAPRIAVAALACFFPTLVNSTRGLRAGDASTMELMRLLAATPLQIFIRVRVPSALPYVFASLRIGAAAAVLGAVLAEWIGAESGLGLLMLWSMFTFLVPRLWATVLVSATVACLAYLAVGWIERVMVPWAGEVSEV